MSASRPRISDVAARAGVTKGTVSRTLSGNYPVSAHTRKAVMEAVAELGYSPSPQATALATGRSNTIAILMTEPFDHLFDDPTFRTIAAGIVQALAPTQFVPLLLQAATPSEQDKAMSALTNGIADGVIHLSAWADEETLPQIVAKNIPCVVCGEPVARSLPNRATRSSHFGSVFADDIAGGELAARYLKDCGATLPVAILGVADEPATIERLCGYGKVFPQLLRENNPDRDSRKIQADKTSFAQAAKHQLGDGSSRPHTAFIADRIRDARNLERVSFGGWGYADGERAMREIIASGTAFDAVLCGSDRIARGALSVLSDNNIAVPDEVQVVGFDDAPIATSQEPTLTTIAQPMEAQGRAAVEMLLGIIGGNPAHTKILQVQLRERQTTRRPELGQ